MVRYMANNRNIIRRIFGRSETRSFADSAFFGRRGSYRAQSTMTLSAVYRAVQLISDSVACLPIMVYRNGRRMTGDTLCQLLNGNPTNIMTRYQLLKKIVTDVLLQGNSYALIIRDPDNGAKVTRLRWLDPSKMTVMYDEESDTKAYSYNGINGLIDSSDILHFMGYSEDGITGISVLQHAVRTMKVATDSENTAMNYFRNGGSITGVLNYKSPLTNSQKEEIRTAWGQIMTSDQGGIAILGGDASFQQVSSSATDMQLIDSRKFNVEEIARFFGVSPTLLGDLTKSSYATFEATSMDFLQNCLQPRLTSIEQEFNAKLLLPSQRKSGYHIAFDTEDLLRCTKSEMASYYNVMIQNGIMSVNEVRRKLDFEPVEGGDEHYIQLNMGTLTSIKNGK